MMKDIKNELKRQLERKELTKIEERVIDDLMRKYSMENIADLKYVMDDIARRNINDKQIKEMLGDEGIEDFFNEFSEEIFEILNGFLYTFGLVGETLGFEVNKENLVTLAYQNVTYLMLSEIEMNIKFFIR